MTKALALLIAATVAAPEQGCIVTTPINTEKKTPKVEVPSKTPMADAVVDTCLWPILDRDSAYGEELRRRLETTKACIEAVVGRQPCLMPEIEP